MNPTMTIESPEWAEAVEARAVKLCVAAEPHDDDMPCVIHRHEACRQIFDLWLGGSVPASSAPIGGLGPAGGAEHGADRSALLLAGTVQPVGSPSQTDNRRGSLTPTAAEGGPVRPQREGYR